MKKPDVPTLLFDLDGTMVDTDPLHLQAFNEMLGRMGRQISPEFYKSHVMGFSDEEILSKLFPSGSNNAPEGFMAGKEALVRRLFTRLTPARGLTELLSRAETHGCPIAVVTNAPRENARLLLEGLGFHDRFATIVLGGELAFGKPHPTPYLTALERLGVSSANAFAFEDSLSGVRSASGAGVRTFGMLTSLPENRLLDAGAFKAIADFADTSMQQLLHPLFADQTTETCPPDSLPGEQLHGSARVR
jgi:HAD superfamily hydrolase (TIGR01509 family)